ncbi:MAG: calcium-binding EGF-like domain-containing protein [Taibaiella sp.]|nr:calcium-binding EGF-like domain-containing protein [Taibaiella sp.]
MKFWKQSLLTVFAFFAVASVVLSTSCQPDQCSTVNCMNGGSCANGFCNCPTGYEGTVCDQQSSTKFVGTYYGNTACDQTPSIHDTATVFLQSAPLTMGIARSYYHDTLYGTISGSNILVNDYIVNDYSRHLTVTLENGNKLVVYSQVYTNDHVQNITIKTVCNFYGTKK